MNACESDKKANEGKLERQRETETTHYVSALSTPETIRQSVLHKKQQGKIKNSFLPPLDLWCWSLDTIPT